MRVALLVVIAFDDVDTTFNTEKIPVACTKRKNFDADVGKLPVKDDLMSRFN